MNPDPTQFDGKRGGLYLLATVLLMGGIVGCGKASPPKSECVLVIDETTWSMPNGDPPYTVGEVKERYGEPEEVVKREYSTELVYSKAGVSFICHGLTPDTAISEMILYAPFSVRTSDGIVLGKSTAQDTQNLWGKLDWYGRTDLPGYALFSHGGVRFLVSANPADEGGQDHLSQTIERMMLFYSDLKRLEYVPPTPVTILADSTAFTNRITSIDLLLEQVVVEVLDLDLDAHIDPDWGPLWDNFANRPYEKQFNGLSTQGWCETWERFEKALVNKARKQKLDAASLDRILKAAKPAADHRNAVVPVATFLARKGGDPVWIVVTKWEWAGPDEHNGRKEWMTLGHIIIQAFRVSDGELLDGISCG